VRLPATEISPELAMPDDPTLRSFVVMLKVPVVTVRSPFMLRGEASGTNMSDALSVRLL